MKRRSFLALLIGLPALSFSAEPEYEEYERFVVELNEWLNKHTYRTSSGVACRPPPFFLDCPKAKRLV